MVDVSRDVLRWSVDSADYWSNSVRVFMDFFKEVYSLTSCFVRWG